MMGIGVSFFKRNRIYKLFLLAVMLLYMSVVSISLSGCAAPAALTVASEVGMTGMVFANSPIADAIVTVYNAATGTVAATATTGSDGTYSVPALPTDATYYVVATGGTVNGNSVNAYVKLLSVFNPSAPNNPPTVNGSYIVDLNETITAASLYAMVNNGAAVSPISVNSSNQVSINTSISPAVIDNAATAVNSMFNTSPSNYNSSSTPPSLSSTAPDSSNISALGDALALCVNTSAICGSSSSSPSTTLAGATSSSNSVQGVVNVLTSPPSSTTVSNINSIAVSNSSPPISTATSITYTIGGTVSGGYGPLPNVAVNLYEALPAYNSTPLATATTNSSGSYSLTYTYTLPTNATVSTEAPSFFVTAKTSSGNLLYTAFNGTYTVVSGSSASASITADIDELTSAQVAYYLNSIGGSITVSGSTATVSIPSSENSVFMAYITNISEQLPSSLSSSADELYEVASAVASCVQPTSYCSNSTSLLPSSYIKGYGLFAYDLVSQYSATEANALLTINSDMASASAIPSTWVVPTAPSAPAGLTATAGNAQVALSWSAASGATSYNVYDSTASGGPYTKVTSVTTTSYTVTGLTNGAAYYFVVTAVNSTGESPHSTQATATPVATATAAVMTAAMAYVMNTSGSSPVIDEYSIDPSTGVINPTMVASVTTGKYAYYLRFNGAGTFAYTMDSSQNLWVYSVSAGALTLVGSYTPAQYTGAALPSGGVVYLHVLNDTLYFEVASTSGSSSYTLYAVPISSGGAPNTSSELSISGCISSYSSDTYNKGNNVWLVVSPSSGVYDVEAFALNQATGMLTSTTPVSTTPINSNTPGYVYDLRYGSGEMYIIDSYDITSTASTGTTITGYNDIYDVSFSSTTGALTEIGSPYTVTNPSSSYIVPNQADLYTADASGDIYGCVNTSSSFSCSEVEAYSSYLPSSSSINMFFIGGTLYATNAWSSPAVLYPFTISSTGSLTLQAADEITPPANTDSQYFPMASDSALLALNNNTSTTPSSSVISYTVNASGLVSPSSGATTIISNSANASVNFINGENNLMAYAFDSSNNSVSLYDYAVNSNGTLGSSPYTATMTITPPSGYNSVSSFYISGGFPYDNNDYAYFDSSYDYYMNNGVCSAYPNLCLTPANAVYGSAYFYNTTSTSYENGIYGWQITSSGLTLMNGGTPIISGTGIPYYAEFFSSGAPLVVSPYSSSGPSGSSGPLG